VYALALRWLAQHKHVACLDSMSPGGDILLHVKYCNLYCMVVSLDRNYTRGENVWPISFPEIACVI